MANNRPRSWCSTLICLSAKPNSLYNKAQISGKKIHGYRLYHTAQCAKPFSQADQRFRMSDIRCMYVDVLHIRKSQSEINVTLDRSLRIQLSQID